jgi:hypothetical protein
MYFVFKSDGLDVINKPVPQGWKLTGFSAGFWGNRHITIEIPGHIGKASDLDHPNSKVKF